MQIQSARAPLEGMDEGVEFSRNLRAEIDRAYQASGNRLGWRLLYSPARVLDGANVALIGLNPGGSVVDPDHGEFAMQSGSAYRDEDWPSSSKLQEQVLALFSRLGVNPEDVLAGNLVPFRSPNWKSLKNRDESLSLGFSIWRRILERASPSVIVTMGSEANEAISRLIEAQDIEDVPVGWGRYTASRGRFWNGSWIGLPHLSRFTIMTREASQSALDELFDGVFVSEI